MACIEARGLRKTFGSTVALDGIDLTVEEGQILGIVGPNGAGKTTALNAFLGLTPYQGELKVIGRDPWIERDDLMRDVAFIADVAVLPRWIRVSQLLDYVEGVHPRFDRARAEAFLAKTDIRRARKVRELSKGMVAQLHLAIVMAIDAKLLVLDEPTLGLDILYSKGFYDSLLNDYFDQRRTIVVTTHQVAEIQDILTGLVFINRGRIVLECSMEEFDSRYTEVRVHPDNLAAARALGPIHEREVFGRTVLLFDRSDRSQLTALGEVRTPGIADLFVAVIGRGGRGEPMNDSSSTLPETAAGHERAEGHAAETRPMYWSVRRELWENRSIYLAPLAVTAFVLLGSLISVIMMRVRIERHPTGDSAELLAMVLRPFSMAPAPIMLASFIVGFFYCLDALYGERRDRSILFWKSLPVSDLTTGLSKIAVPLVVLPLIAFVLSVITQIVMLVVSVPVLVVSAVSPWTLWTGLRFFPGLLIMIYGLTVHALWFGPIYAWLLLVSAWARRAPVLWAVLPVLALAAVERIAFGSSWIPSVLQYRVLGAMKTAFTFEHGSEGDVNQLSQLTPVEFLTSPGLWVGLAFAAVCIAVAIRLRRRREPL